MRVLRPLRGDQHSNALGINSAGQVIGHSWNPRRERSFRWDPKTGKSDLGSLGGGFTSVSAINDRGQVVGGSSTPTGEDRAFRWSPKTGMTELGTLGGESSGALAINCGGQVTGSAATESGANHAFVWDSRHGMTDLGTLGGESSGALAINCGGQVTGSAATESGANHAFVWDLRHGMTDLGTLGGNQVSTGLDINRRDRWAGTSSIGDYSYVGSDDWATAVLWSPRVTVAVKAVHERTRLRLDVNPNLRAAHWRVTIPEAPRRPHLGQGSPHPPNRGQVRDPHPRPGPRHLPGRGKGAIWLRPCHLVSVARAPVILDPSPWAKCTYTGCVKLRGVVRCRVLVLPG